MSQSTNNLNGDPCQLPLKQKVAMFEMSGERSGQNKPLTFFNNFGAVKKQDFSSSDNNSSLHKSYSTNKTSTPVPIRNSASFPRVPSLSDQKNVKYVNKGTSYRTTYIPNQVTNRINQIINDHKSSSSRIPEPPRAEVESPVDMREFHATIKDLDTFLIRQLNEVEIEKRIGKNNLEKLLYDSKEHEKRYEDQVLTTLQKLKDEINEIKQNQREFENKMRKDKEHQLIAAVYANKNGRDKHLEATNSKSSAVDTELKKNFSSQFSQKPVGISVNSQKVSSSGYFSKERTESDRNDLKKINSHDQNTIPLPPKQHLNEKAASSHYDIPTTSSRHSRKERTPVKKDSNKMKINFGHQMDDNSDSTVMDLNEYTREERIRKLESEIYKEETLMMRINHVLESLNNVDDRHLLDIINIERHYLVASTRFQAALSELRKLNEGGEPTHMPPFNRKGKLLIRDIMLEIKPSYFQRAQLTKNEFLLVLMKYEDKVYASKPMRIIDDIRVVKFTEKFSIPDMYMDFDMRLEIYGTTFWRKNTTGRATMLKKYGFINFSLADTGHKSKRFQMIEVLHSENLPIRSKVMMKITQKITTGVQYKGNLFVKIRDNWHEAAAHLNGHLLEISFRRMYNSDIACSQEALLLDLYNVDSDAVIPVDIQRVSDKPYTFLLKFNHYVDVANFYLMLAAENAEAFGEWVKALNKVLVLIK